MLTYVVMSEQEREKETRVLFPRVPKEIIDRVVSIIKEQPVEIFESCWDGVEVSDSYLYKTVGVMQDDIENDDDKHDFVFGATLVAQIFKFLGEQGIFLPPVRKDTAVVFLEELADAKSQFIKSGSKPEVRELATDFNFPHPYKYAEENPTLMVFIAYLPSVQARGAITVYELKRRQFHANLLAKQLGG